VNPKDVTISTGRKIQLKVPVNISNNSNVKIIFTENFGIKIQQKAEITLFKLQQAENQHM